MGILAGQIGVILERFIFRFPTKGESVSGILASQLWTPLWGEAVAIEGGNSAWLSTASPLLRTPR